MQFSRLFIAAMALFLVVSCNKGQSLQEYYVDNKEDDDFVMVDVPTSLISPESNMLDEDQKEVLATVKKINIMAYPIKNGDMTKYKTETEKVKKILSSDDYEELMSFGNGGQRMRLYFKGEEDAIDEVIVYVQDAEKGFLLARVLGDDMNITSLSSLVKSFQNGEANVDISQFEGIMDVFGQ
ncbi:MAG: hypothetical protein CL868_21125 [Cytophagaceae bacterium]|nr:hypothetical protein [Cytophagaceae bacterium]